MALIIETELVPDAEPVSPPDQITFSLQLSDDEAPPAQTHRLVLSLAASNALFFETAAGGQAKSLNFDRTISQKPKVQSFLTKVVGDPGDLGSFQVSIDVPGTSGSSCLVELK